MRVIQKTNYYLSKSGRFGNYYSRQNVTPYCSVWKVVTKYFHDLSDPKMSIVKDRICEPVCVYHNVTGSDDPCISKRIRSVIRSMEDLYYEH